MGKHSGDSAPHRPVAALVALIVLALAAATFYLMARGAGELGKGPVAVPGTTSTVQQTT